jgi:HlyD family secretion protein
MTRIIGLVMLIGIAVGGTALWSHFHSSGADEVPFRTEKVSRGDLHITVRATGTIEPEETVDVGAQVVGRIKELGVDPRARTDPNFSNKTVNVGTPVKKGSVLATVTPIQSASTTSESGKMVDYGSPVEKGMVLAQIDPAVYKAQFDQATAALAQAEARVLQAQAQVVQTTAEWERAQRLSQLTISGRSPTGDASNPSMQIKGISESDYILAQANAETAKADLQSAKAAVLQQQATLELARTNLNYTTIVSPIDGTIIDRRVNVGQTVVSSLNAPSLFLIARDLRRMQVWAAVNEADIANIKEGTKVHFRVDALPKDEFHGRVVQRRYNASMTQNVVTYTVVIGVDNSDLKLLPYLTADVYFEVDDRKDVLLVPNAALRFKPTPEQIARDASAEEPEPAAPSKTGKTGHGRRGKVGSEPETGKLWEIVPGTAKLRPVTVQLGESDMAFTEIVTDHLHEGAEVVTGEVRQTSSSSGDVTNPLGPPRFRGSGRPK